MGRNSLTACQAKKELDISRFRSGDCRRNASRPTVLTASFITLKANRKGIVEALLGVLNSRNARTHSWGGIWSRRATSSADLQPYTGLGISVTSCEFALYELIAHVTDYAFLNKNSFSSTNGSLISNHTAQMAQIR